MHAFPDLARRPLPSHGAFRICPAQMDARHSWRVGRDGAGQDVARAGCSASRWPECGARCRSKVLETSGSALDAVEAAIRVLEDDPHFNAGRGAVFTWEGRNELDAAIMDGRTRAAGAVAGVTRTRNPVSLARAVMEKSPHVFLGGEGADLFSVEQGLPQVDPAWFATPERRNGGERKELAHDRCFLLPRDAITGSRRRKANFGLNRMMSLLCSACVRSGTAAPHGGRR